jgi:hypothetical protein
MFLAWDWPSLTRVQLPALSASDLEYRVYVVLDTCGGMSDRSEQAALLRMTKAGATTVSVTTLAGELPETSAMPRRSRPTESFTGWRRDKACAG